ncbi:MAG: hypothetical protein H6809_07750 [Phycisphaeraceae bacterium]|nr:hypothetical protein [Phycisphaeraceae bacterium]
MHASTEAGTGPIASNRGRTQHRPLGWLAVLAIIPALLMAGCGRDASRAGYDQSTPEGVIKTARLMVEGGHAERLGELMYADSPEWRELYLRLGELLGDIQDLGESVAQHMPEQVEEVKAETMAAAEQGRASNYLQQVLTGRRPQASRTPAGQSAADPRDMLSDTLKQISADPYGWVAQSEDRLGFQWIDDYTVALTWDDRAILPPIGITMRQADDGLWYLVLPTSLPQVRPVVPDTPEEFSIWASLVQVMRNAVQDMRTSVETRQVVTLDDLSRKAGENLLIPAGLVMVAYAKLVEDDMRQQREARRAERRAQEAAQPQQQTPEAPAPAPEPQPAQADEPPANPAPSPTPDPG